MSLRAREESVLKGATFGTTPEIPRKLGMTDKADARARRPLRHRYQRCNGPWSRAVRAFGCLDALVTCPTLEPRLCGPAESLALDSFLGGISSNLSDTFFDCQAAAAQMLQQVCPHATPNNRGRIITMTSVAGVVALPGHVAFCSAMAGLTAATRVLATEWGPRGIRGAGQHTPS